MKVSHSWTEYISRLKPPLKGIEPSLLRCIVFILVENISSPREKRFAISSISLKLLDSILRQFSGIPLS